MRGALSEEGRAPQSAWGEPGSTKSSAHRLGEAVFKQRLLSKRQGKRAGALQVRGDLVNLLTREPHLADDGVLKFRRDFGKEREGGSDGALCGVDIRDVLGELMSGQVRTIGCVHNSKNKGRDLRHGPSYSHHPRTTRPRSHEIIYVPVTGWINIATIR